MHTLVNTVVDSAERAKRLDRLYQLLTKPVPDSPPESQTLSNDKVPTSRRRKRGVRDEG